MRGAKPPIVFVMAVAGSLLAGALGLVVFAAGPGRHGDERTGQAAQTPSRPTGSSITAATPRPLPDSPWPDSPWPGVSTSTEEPAATGAPATTASSRPRPSQAAPTAQGTPMTVSYSVAGSSAATVLTYWRGDHDIASEHGTALPWSRTVTLTEQSLIRLSAQVDHGSVRCAITVDGQVVAEAAAEYFVSCETRPSPATHDG